MQVWPDKMAPLTLGGEYGAATESGRQEEQRGDNAQSKLRKGPQFKDTVPESSKQRQEGLTNQIVNIRSEKADRSSGARA